MEMVGHLPSQSPDFKNALGRDGPDIQVQKFSLGYGDGNVGKAFVDVILAHSCEDFVLWNEERVVIFV